MSRALPGEHCCLAHQGNHSHYAEHNCRVCTLERRLAAQEPGIVECLRIAVESELGQLWEWLDSARATWLENAKAALTAYAQEPVAWQYRLHDSVQPWCDCTQAAYKRMHVNEIYETRALYAAPVAQPLAEWVERARTVAKSLRTSHCLVNENLTPQFDGWDSLATRAAFELLEEIRAHLTAGGGR